MKTKLFSFSPDKHACNCVMGLARQVVENIGKSGGEVKSIQFWPAEGGTACAILANVPEDYTLPERIGFY